jgi:hypothetical protein
MGGTAVKKWHKRKNTEAEGYEIRGECVRKSILFGERRLLRAVSLRAVADTG